MELQGSLLCSQELATGIIRVIKLKGVRWAGHVACMEEMMET
jgi:hypothetical protein